MRTSGDSTSLKLIAGVAVAAGAVALGGSCGGGGGGDDEALPTAIDMASVTSAIGEFGGFVAICQQGTSGRMHSARALKLLPALLRGGTRDAGTLAARPIKRALALTSTPPADSLGDCGGRMGYRD
jgi:hypothetical protein